MLIAQAGFGLHLPDDVYNIHCILMLLMLMLIVIAMILMLQVLVAMLRLVLGYTSLMIHLGGVGTGNGYFEWREPWANHYKYTFKYIQTQSWENH